MTRKTLSVQTLLFVFSMLVLSFSFYSCKKQKTAKKPSASISSYVYAYTSGIVSKAAPVRVRFAQGAVEEAQVGAQAEGIISFSPSVKGVATWEDEQTLVFEAEEYFKSGQDYVAKVELKKVFPAVAKDVQRFEFDFHIRELHFQVDIDGLKALDFKDLSQQELLGRVTTTDVVDQAGIEGLLNATQNAKTLDVEWSHSGDMLVHSFIVKGVNRGEQASKVALSWNGKSIKVDQKDKKEVEVPQLGDFKVVDARVVQDEEQYIQLQFSDPLLASQTLNGLVSVNNFNGNYRYIVDGSLLRIYPSSRLRGEQKVIVQSGVKNINGSRMKNASEWFISFEEVKPQVRLVGNGVILPNSDGLIFPFEAVSLNGVEIEVFKIYNNNILQFLQTNTLDGNYDLYRVGRVIMQREISLKDLNPSANSGGWVRYALDLNNLIEEDPEAIYQVRIGFKQSHATYYCNNKAEDTNDELRRTESNLDDNGEIKSFMDSWYGRSGYYEGYTWEHRDNPCFPAYYSSRRFVQRNVLASNLGIIAKGGKDKSFQVIVTDLRNSDPVPNTTIEFYDYQQQLLQTATTDSKGMATAQLERTPFVLIARNGPDKGYLRLQEGNSLSLSKFNVSGKVVQKGIKGYLYGDRGVWRPGDTVFLNFILEDKSNKLPENYPINFELYDARGQLHFSRAVVDHTNMLYPLHFATSTEDPTGNWRAVVKAGGATFNKTLRIETVKPNRLKIDLDFGGEELQIVNGTFSGDLQVNWLHGAPGRNLKAQVDMKVDPVKTTFEEYKEYRFDDPARSFYSEMKTIFNQEVDQDGYAKIQGRVPSKNNIPGKMVAKFKTRAFEKGGEFSTDNFSIPFYPFEHFAGVKIPRNKYREKRLDVDKEGNIAMVVVDKDGKGVSGKNLSVGLYRVKWRWWWDSYYDNVSRYNSSQHLDAEKKGEMVTNQKGEAEWAVKVNKWGRYMIRVCDTESGHCTGDYFYAGYPWYDDDDSGQFKEAAAMLTLSSDKEKYATGETVKLTIPTGEEGRALITIENGTKVVESFWANAVKGENEFTFEATAEMTPNVYAHVSLIQPHAQVKNDLPIRLYGVVPVMVEDPDTRLEPTIKMPEELRPEAKFTVEVSEEDGKPMTYTLAVVDEGLLGLTRFKTPNPWDAFYAREALGVRTWDVYDQVLGAYGGELERILSIGGDGELQPGDVDNQANRFKPVVMNLGPFHLKKGKKAKHEITMPNYVGAVRTMVVAEYEGAYGNASQTALVKKPLMILATLPRVMGPGETMKLPVNVFAMDKKVKNATITVKESSGLVGFEGPASKSIAFDKPGDAVIDFNVKVKEEVGVAHFTVTAEGAGEKASHEIEIDIRNPNPYVTDVYAEILAGGKDWKTDFSPPGMSGTNTAVLEVSNIPPINLGKRLRYLLRYPYGCVEQTVSSGFPQLYVSKLVEMDEVQKTRVKENIEATILSLKHFQTAEGGFAYWPGNDYPDPWGTNYAGHFLLEAKALGYTVPASMLQRWEKFQKKAARMWDVKLKKYGLYSRNSYELTQSYRLYTMALAGKPDLSSMNLIRESKELTMQARWRLAAAYALAGKPEVGTNMIQNLSTDIKDYTELSYTYGSGLRDRAMVLETLILLGKETAAAEMVKIIADQLSSQRWYGTQTVAYSLLAIGKFVGNSEVSDKLEFAYQLGTGNSINAGSISPVFQIDVPVDDNGVRSLTVQNKSQSVLYARLIVNGQPLVGEETDNSNDLDIEVVYKATNGNIIDPESIPQGTDFIAQVTVTHPGIRAINYDEMALRQIFPSGWEILNTRMDAVSNVTTSVGYDYQDFRDDRVYTFFDIRPKKAHTYQVQLNAAYQGRFYLPAVSCEAMYDNSITARKAGKWVEVTVPGEL